MLIAGLLGNLIRFLYISFITWPWLVLPFEFLQGLHRCLYIPCPPQLVLTNFKTPGITHAAVWAACCSFISHNTDAELRPSAQGVLQVCPKKEREYGDFRQINILYALCSIVQGVHHGFGRFCGAVFGGMLIKTHGELHHCRNRFRVI